MEVRLKRGDCMEVRLTRGEVWSELTCVTCGSWDLEVLG